MTQQAENLRIIVAFTYFIPYLKVAEIIFLKELCGTKIKNKFCMTQREK